MSAIWRRFVPAVISAGFFSLAPLAHADSPEAMQQRIDRLQSKIQTLEQKKSQNQTDVGASIQQVMQDADRHSLLMDVSGINVSGYDAQRGFVLSSDDGAYVIHPNGLLQFRDVVTDRQHIRAGGGGVTGATGYDIANGFELSRVRIGLDGSVISPNVTYFFQFDADQGSPITLLDAYVMWRVSNQSSLALKAGQFKDPLFHEKNLLPGKQLAVDRSLLDNYIGGGETQRVQGGEVVYDEDKLRGVLAFHDGYNSGNTAFYDAGGLGATIGAGAGLAPTNWGVTVRAEYLLMGNRKPEFNPYSEYDQFSALGATESIIVVGAGAEYTESGDNKYVPHTVDIQYVSPSGLSLYAAYEGTWQSLPTFKGVRQGFYYDNGFLVQAGYMVTDKFEPFARYDYTYIDGHATPGIFRDQLHEITVGANYYVHGQNLKFTVDATWLPNGCPTDVTNLGYLKNDGRNEFVLRAQVQLAI